MACEKYAPLISMYLDGELNNIAELEQHMKECPACAATLQEYRAIQHAVKGYTQQGVEHYFMTRLYQRIEHAELHKKTISLRVRLVGLAACVCIIAFGMFKFSMPNSEQGCGGYTQAYTQEVDRFFDSEVMSSYYSF